MDEAPPEAVADYLQEHHTPAEVIALYIGNGLLGHGDGLSSAAMSEWLRREMPALRASSRPPDSRVTGKVDTEPLWVALRRPLERMRPADSALVRFPTLRPTHPFAVAARAECPRCRSQSPYFGDRGMPAARIRCLACNLDGYVTDDSWPERRRKETGLGVIGRNPPVAGGVRYEVRGRLLRRVMVGVHLHHVIDGLLLPGDSSDHEVRPDGRHVVVTVRLSRYNVGPRPEHFFEDARDKVLGLGLLRDRERAVLADE